MCTGLEPLLLNAAIAGGTTLASAALQKAMAPDPPEAPRQRQPAKPPRVDTRDQRGPGRGPAYGMRTPSLLSSGATRSNSLLGS